MNVYYFYIKSSTIYIFHETYKMFHLKICKCSFKTMKPFRLSTGYDNKDDDGPHVVVEPNVLHTINNHPKDIINYDQRRYKKHFTLC